MENVVGLPTTLTDFDFAFKEVKEQIEISQYQLGGEVNKVVENDEPSECKFSLYDGKVRGIIYRTKVGSVVLTSKFNEEGERVFKVQTPCCLYHCIPGCDKPLSEEVVCWIVNYPNRFKAMVNCIANKL